MQRSCLGGTDNHLVLIDLRKFDVSGAELEERLDAVHITTNKNKIPNDPRSAKETSGLRLGTAAITTRGFKEKDMIEVADMIFLAIKNYEGQKENILKRVDELCAKYPIYE